jgi:hypothetical protein
MAPPSARATSSSCACSTEYPGARTLSGLAGTAPVLAARRLFCTSRCRRRGACFARPRQQAGATQAPRSTRTRCSPARARRAQRDQQQRRCEHACRPPLVPSMRHACAPSLPLQVVLQVPAVHLGEAPGHWQVATGPGEAATQQLLSSWETPGTSRMAGHGRQPQQPRVCRQLPSSCLAQTCRTWGASRGGGGSKLMTSGRA